MDKDQELRDDELDIVDEETHDKEKAEEQSVKSVDKTDDKIKRAPARKGDKRNSDPMPKSKAGKVGALYDKISLLAKEDLERAYDLIMDENFLEENVESRETPAVEVNYEDDLDALVESEATLSEGFREKAATIFEAALNSRVVDEVTRLEENYQERLDEELATTREELIESVDSYLNYAVETFMENNKLAVQNGLRTEIAESFMDKLKTVFEESYIDVPESKIDMVDELAEQVEELEDSLNESTAKQIAMAEELEDYKRAEIVAENFDGLSETQAAKLAELAENVSFDNADDFSEKVKALKESLNTATKTDESIVEENEEGDEPLVESNDRMAAYNAAINRQK